MRNGNLRNFSLACTLWMLLGWIFFAAVPSVTSQLISEDDFMIMNNENEKSGTSENVFSLSNTSASQADRLEMRNTETEFVLGKRSGMNSKDSPISRIESNISGGTGGNAYDDVKEEPFEDEFENNQQPRRVSDDGQDYFYPSSSTLGSSAPGSMSDPRFFIPSKVRVRFHIYIVTDSGYRHVTITAPIIVDSNTILSDLETTVRKGIKLEDFKLGVVSWDRVKELHFKQHQKQVDRYTIHEAATEANISLEGDVFFDVILHLDEVFQKLMQAKNDFHAKEMEYEEAVKLFVGAQRKIYNTINEQCKAMNFEQFSKYIKLPAQITVKNINQFIENELFKVILLPIVQEAINVLKTEWINFIQPHEVCFDMKKNELIEAYHAYERLRLKFGGPQLRSSHITLNSNLSPGRNNNGYNMFGKNQ